MCPILLWWYQCFANSSDDILVFFRIVSVEMRWSKMGRGYVLTRTATDRWLSAGLRYPQYVSNGETAVLHKAIELMISSKFYFRRNTTMFQEQKFLNTRNAQNIETWLHSAGDREAVRLIKLASKNMWQIKERVRGLSIQSTHPFIYLTSSNQIWIVSFNNYLLFKPVLTRLL